MGWKPKNESTAPECVGTLPHLDVRNVGLNTDTIIDCLAYAIRLERETGSDRQEEFANTVNRLTDEQVRVFTQCYKITPATRKGIILWNDSCGEDKELE